MTRRLERIESDIRDAIEDAERQIGITKAFPVTFDLASALTKVKQARLAYDELASKRPVAVPPKDAA